MKQLNLFSSVSPLTHLLRLALGVAAALGTLTLKLDYIESLFFDLRVAYRPAPALSNHIAIIHVRPETKDKFGAFPDYQNHADLLGKLSAAEPKAVVFVMSPQDINGSPEQKTSFAQATDKIPQFYFSADHATFKGGLEIVPFPAPLDKIKIIPGSRTTDSDKFAKDGVSRRIVLSFQGVRYLHPRLAEIYNPELAQEENIRGQFNVFDSKQIFINYHPTNSFPTYRFEDVYDGKISAEHFKDKVIFIGSDTEFDNKDYALTPYSRERAVLNLAELHANMLETLITNSAPRKVPQWFDFVVALIISVLTIHVVLTLRPLPGILLLGATGLVFSLISYLAFWPFGFIIDMAHPFLAIFLCYYFFIPYRLIVENRRSWEYYQKHKLLSEVEELKTNFIGMMSHDLKTPLARIQGMTEVISKDSAPLSSGQREALDMIKQSASDLTKFISTILNYAKIESQGVELHLESKDINQILQEVVKKHEFHAKVKQIKLVTELEPLFSIQVDPELMKQVLSNLVENAIKYSPENSKVLISTEEVDGKVVIQVADQGMGIPAEELPHVFMKFFRSREAKSSPIKGSGLGLYLAKYFVELHKGQIFVESSPGQGSTFTVELPLHGA